MSDETMSEAQGASDPNDTPTPAREPRAEGPSSNEPAPPDPAGGTGNAESRESTGSGDGSGPGLDADGQPRKRRRRGSRGGRNRRPATANGGGENGDGGSGGNNRGRGGGSSSGSRAEGATRAQGGAREEGKRGRNENAAADRGLTTDDLAETAMEDAGLRTPRVGDTRPVPSTPPPRPKVGDSRPSAPSGGGGNGDGEGEGDDARAGAPRKRRRRGGRGRGRSGSGSGAGNRPAQGGADGSATEVVTAAVSADDGFDIEDLDEETLARRRGRTRKGRPTGRYQMVVHVRDGVIQMAVLEGRVLTEHYVSRSEDDATSIDGNIYLGKVQNVLPGMEAAFVDIGTPKNGVLYRGDVSFDESQVEEAAPKIERLLKNGQPVLVQVTKNPIGAKGARLTQEVSLAGRFVVMVPNQPGTYGISKRLPDDERRRLRKVLEGIRPENAGLIVRTAADGASAEELARDLKRLSAQWEDISKRAAKNRPAMLLHQEPDLAIRVIREEFNKEYRGVVIDDPVLFEEIRRYVEAITPELADRVELYQDQLPIFERYHVHEQLHKALERKVWLPSGGSIIIERTEALTVIDVNTGKNVGSSNLEETVYRNNLEAADAVARELRLRDIGGIIVIDFIDMEIKSNREAVEDAFRQALARDKTRTQVFPISELGLVEMTRKRVSEGLVEAFSSTCPHCNGRGFVVDESMFD